MRKVWATHKSVRVQAGSMQQLADLASEHSTNQAHDHNLDDGQRRGDEHGHPQRRHIEKGLLILIWLPAQVQGTGVKTAPRARYFDRCVHLSIVSPQVQLLRLRTTIT